jgi:hypothetical protein
MEQRKVRVWVDPKFKMELKKEAATKETSILNYTKFLAQKEENLFFEDTKELKKKKRGSLFENMRF